MGCSWLGLASLGDERCGSGTAMFDALHNGHMGHARGDWEWKVQLVRTPAGIHVFRCVAILDFWYSKKTICIYIYIFIYILSLYIICI